MDNIERGNERVNSTGFYDASVCENPGSEKDRRRVKKGVIV